MFKFERIDAAAVILQISTHALIRPDGQDTQTLLTSLCVHLITFPYSFVRFVFNIVL